MAEKNTSNIGFEKQIWDAACVLWGHIPASEYRNVIIGLIFLKYISTAFDKKYQQLVAEGEGFEDDPDAYLEDNVFFVPEDARWDKIAAAAHKPEIGTVIDDAMRAIEADNKKLKNVLPKNYASPDLDKRVLGDVVDLFTNMDMGETEGNRDILGRTYEYCIAQFAEKEGKGGGEFYTPSSIVNTLVSILKPYSNCRVYDGMIQLLEEAEKEGIDVSFDQYPYVAGSTMLGVILPPWVHDGGTNKVIERLNDPELRKKMVYDIEHGIPGWDNFVDFAGLDQIYVTSVKTDKNKDAVGLSLIELGKLRGKDPYDATFDLLRDEENAVGMVDFYGTEDHVKLFMKRPEMNVCTDGLLGGKPHPRVYGAFPRVLGKYVREDKALTLEQAVYKMTGKPAATFNIKNRGQIKEGAYADITVFNPDTVIDKGTFTDPTQYPEGIEYVMVNGVFEVAGGKYTGRRNGTVLRKKGKEVVK